MSVIGAIGQDTGLEIVLMIGIMVSEDLVGDQGHLKEDGMYLLSLLALPLG